MKNLGWFIGLIIVIPHGLQYNAAAEFDANSKQNPSPSRSPTMLIRKRAADVSESLRNLMMRHADSRTLIKHCLLQRIDVDARAIGQGLEPQYAMVKAASRMS